jgi:proteasome component ECM29
MPYINIEVMKEMLPSILELSKSPQLGTKVACCHFMVLAAHYLRADLEPVAGKLLAALLNGTFDRNATVRKNYAEALGQVSAYAKVIYFIIIYTVGYEWSNRGVLEGRRAARTWP